MTLDITKVASQVGEMVVMIKSDSREQGEHLKTASGKMRDKTLNAELLKRKIALSRTQNWSAAGLVDGLNLHYPVPVVPDEYLVLATDGSHIDVDRHQAARCYLINIGTVKLGYGKNPLAELESIPHLYAEEKDLVIKSENNQHKEQPIEGTLLDAKRSVEEVNQLVILASSLPVEGYKLALLDGSLVLFGMQNFPEYVVSEIVDKGFLQAMKKLKSLSQTQNLMLASYISFPRSDDVVNALKIAICPHEYADCDRYCQIGAAPCDVVSGVNDRMLFTQFLNFGERSALFTNPSKILERYGEHKVYFFYLKIEDEIARVEIPEWIAASSSLLNLTHALVLDQCRRGQGYPVALSEAHEKAVVTGADREEFWGLVDTAMEAERISVVKSTKSRSKRTRWL